MNAEEVLDIISELSSLRFFPSNNAGARLAIARQCVSMASNIGQIEHLVARMTNGDLYNEWPGPAEMRACFCSMYRPKDGLEASSSVYPDGLPSAAPQAAPALNAPLPKGLLYSADTEFDATMRELAEIQAARNKAIAAAAAAEPAKPTQEEIDAIKREQNARRKQ